MIVSAWRSFSASRRFSRSSRSFSATKEAFGGGLSPATLGRQPCQRSFVPLFPPSIQVRRVQALAAKQSAELATPSRTIGLAKNADLVLGGEASTHGPLRHGRVRDRLPGGTRSSPRPPTPSGGVGGGRNLSRATPSFSSACPRLFHSRHPCFLHLSTSSLPSTVIPRPQVSHPLLTQRAMPSPNRPDAPKSLQRKRQCHSSQSPFPDRLSEPLRVRSVHV